MSWFWPAFWWLDNNIYLDFSVFTSGPTSLVESIRVSVLGLLHSHWIGKRTGNTWMYIRTQFYITPNIMDTFFPQIFPPKFPVQYSLICSICYVFHYKVQLKTLHNKTSSSYYRIWLFWGHVVAGWLRHYTTGWKAMGLIPDEVIGFFNWSNPSSHIMALGSSQSPIEMSTRNLHEGKGWRARKADNLTTLWACMACYRDSFTFYITSLFHNNDNSCCGLGYGLWDTKISQEYTASIFMTELTFTLQGIFLP
jgi:hypothetical protein